MENRIHKKHSIIISWLISYVSVLLVPIIISGIVYINSANIIKNEINRANAALLQQVKQIIDSRMLEVEQLDIHVELSENIQKIINEKSLFNNRDKYIISQIVNELTGIQIENKFVADIFVYLHNQGSIITGEAYYDAKTLKQPLIQNNGIIFEDLLNVIKEENQKKIFVFPGTNIDKSRNQFLVYSKPVLSKTLYKPSATVVILINENELLQAITNIEWLSKGSVLILDKENKVLASTTNIGKFTSSLKYEDFNEAYGLKQYDMEREEVSVSYVSSNVMKWKYISVIPSRIYIDKAIYIRKLTNISLLICVLLGGVVAYLNTKRNYKPVYRLVTALAKKADVSMEKGYNEYSFIEDTVNSTLKSKEELDRLLQKQNYSLRSNFLTKLLKGKVDENMPVSDLLTSYDIDPISDSFSVMMFYIDDFPEVLLEPDMYENIENLTLVQFIIKNVVEELVGIAHKGYVTEIDNMMVCLINLNKADNDSDSVLYDIAQKARDFLEEKFKIKLTVSISMIHKGIKGIPAAYNHAFELMSYKMLMGNGKIIVQKDIQNNISESRNYYYPMEKEQQWINAIKAGDLNLSQQILTDIYNNNFHTDTSISLSMAKCLIFDLVSTIAKVLNDLDMLNDKLLFEDLKSIDRLINCKTVKEVKKTMNDILLKVCGYVEQNKRKHSEAYIGNIMEYVKEHYHNEDLSVSMIADKFQMNLSYISNVFKKENGEGLYDYINKIRISKAKRLIGETDLNIGEIARKVGYYNDNSFIRVFKKYEGITPGKYKEILRN